jgi:hypothetical protein
MKSNNPKNQHWVPRFYLRYFSTNDSRTTDVPKAYFWDKSKGREGGPTSIENLCGQRYLYSPLDKAGNRDWGLESYLDRLETKAGAIWPILNEGFPKLTDPEMRDVLSTFIAVMHIRNVNVYRLIDSTIDLRNKLFGELTSEELAARSPDLPDLSDSGRFFADTIRNDVPRITAMISQMRWRVLLTESDAFVTSDRPVVFLHPERRGGLGVSGGFFLFPFGPRRLLVGDDQVSNPAHDYYPLDRTQVGHFNCSMRDESIRFAITGRPLSEVLKEVREAETRAKARTESRKAEQTNT